MINICLLPIFVLHMPRFKFLMLPLVMLVLVHLLAGNILQLARWQAQHAMEEKLEEDQLVTLENIPLQHITWVKQGKEILINGRLFDVKDIIEMENGLLSVTGLYDTQEQEILTKLQQMNSGEQGNTHKLLTGLFQQVYINTPAVQYQQLFITVQARSTDTGKQVPLPENCKEIPTPPPQA